MRTWFCHAIAILGALAALPVSANDDVRERSIAAVDAIEQRDAEKVAAIIAPDFVAINTRGDLRDGEELVTSLRNWPFERRPAPLRIWTQVRIRESETGATFVARSQVVAEGEDAQAIHSTLYTLRWTRDADGWQLSGYQSVRMPALPDIVTVRSGELNLKAMVYRPQGKGPFPVVVYAHGNEPDPTSLFESVGPAIAARGYYVIGVHRRGSGLSADQAPNLLAQLTEIQKNEGDAARAQFAIAQLEGPQLDDLAAAIAMAASHPEIERKRIFVIGNSFGGVLALLAAERGLGLKGAADFAGSAMNWEGSALFRERMREAARNARIPIFLGQAANDFSTQPTIELAKELAASGKPYRARVFPTYGIGPVDGHGFGIHGVDLWFDEVMGFLDPPPANHDPLSGQRLRLKSIKSVSIPRL
ncbi:Dienelactone hydrolase [Altererythrobacter xiamenensis]|uniref:Dienelactone hydrolase n=2 Tax=Altererythrobacter xiamenensis TaxID=1316679 RepID=A0A1Y6EVF6_9SPHN|nr:Dienelactone hydrolase [Altererythrobacter xiamenensis]